jgi:hypothetical protein
VKGVEPSTFTLATGDASEPNSFADKEQSTLASSVDTKYAQNPRHTEIDAELQAIIDAWPNLAPNLRSAMVNIIGSPLSATTAK